MYNVYTTSEVDYDRRSILNRIKSNNIQYTDGTEMH